jgi:hypothetical protein
MNKYYRWLLHILTTLFIINMALYDFKDPEKNLGIMLSNLMVILVFIFDIVAKIIGRGIYQHKNAFLRDGFNILDLVLVLGFLFSFNEDPDTFMGAFGLLRALMALKLINSN